MTYLNLNDQQYIKNNSITQYETYGKAIKIKRKWMIIGYTILCLITPFTSWSLIFIKKIIKNDLIIRYE